MKTRWLFYAIVVALAVAALYQVVPRAGKPPVLLAGETPGG